MAVDVSYSIQEDRSSRFERLMREQGPGLSRVAASYARSAAEREDLEQDIALALWRALPSFRAECSERTFTFRVAHNRGLSLVARRVPIAEHGEPEPASLTPDPEAALGHAEQRERLFRALRQLPVSYRQVLTLSLEGLSQAEAGEVLGISANNVAVRLGRAKEALRKALGENR